VRTDYRLILLFTVVVVLFFLVLGLAL